MISITIVYGFCVSPIFVENVQVELIWKKNEFWNWALNQTLLGWYQLKRWMTQ
jgi:hypothetical protein